MQIITLTTDWNQQDYYSGIIKSYLITSLPDIKIVDITHSIPPFDCRKACFVVKSVYKSFPENTVHIVGVRGLKNELPAPPMVIRFKDQWFFGYENNSFVKMFECEKNVEHWYLPIKFDTTFPELDYLVKTAVEMIKGVDIKETGIKFLLDSNSKTDNASLKENSITGIVEYIDSYGNAITNIEKNDFERICRGRRFEITVTKRCNAVRKISQSYNEPSDKLIAVFNILDKLEIAHTNTKAVTTLGITVNSQVNVIFFN